jgi:hypothetical protein
MAQIDIRNILVGYGDLYYGLQGTPLPTWDIASVSLKEDFVADNNWDYAGATQEGVELAYAPEYGEVNVDQLGDAAVMFFESASVTLNTTLAEATLENLLIAWGMSDAFLQQTAGGEVSQFSIGIGNETPEERSIAVVGKGAPTADGDRRDRVYLGRRVLAVEGASLALRRSENTSFPISFRLLADPAFQGSEYGTIVDRIPGDTTAAPDVVWPVPLNDTYVAP